MVRLTLLKRKCFLSADVLVFGRVNRESWSQHQRQQQQQWQQQQQREQQQQQRSVLF
jgi:hypothetical protein